MTRTFFVRTSFLSTCALTLALAVACGGPTANNNGNLVDANGNPVDANGNLIGGDGDTIPGDDSIIPVDDTASGDGDMREPECDAAGNCVCIKLATWGALGTFGAVPGMDGSDAITAWLNANSTGEADYTAAKPAITADYLVNYDVIILQNLSAWPAFSAEELAAFEAWIRAGGGVISLQGYQAEATEVNNVNSLLAFTGMSYNGDDTSGEVAAKANPCSYCYGSSVPQAGWNTANPVAANLTQVGAFHGRSVNPGADGVILAQTAEGVLGATKELDSGRVFMFHDEWVTYNSQWTGLGLVEDCLYNDPNNVCDMKHPSTDYSSAQFWYNSIKWLSGDPACFTISDPTIVK